jgi:hypothetical protein
MCLTAAHSHPVRRRDKIYYTSAHWIFRMSYFALLILIDYGALPYNDDVSLGGCSLPFPCSAGYPDLCHGAAHWHLQSAEQNGSTLADFLTPCLRCHMLDRWTSSSRFTCSSATSSSSCSSEWPIIALRHTHAAYMQSWAFAWSEWWALSSPPTLMLRLRHRRFSCVPEQPSDPCLPVSVSPAGRSVRPLRNAGTLFYPPVHGARSCDTVWLVGPATTTLPSPRPTRSTPASCLSA